MSEILLMGLTDQEAAAVEILIGIHWREYSCITLARSLSLSIPKQSPSARAATACVVDLFGLGMRKHSPANEASLLEVLGGRSAVLLCWGEGGGWLESRLALAAAQRIVWLRVPASPAKMREALGKVLAGAASAARADPQSVERTPSGAIGMRHRTPAAAAARPQNGTRPAAGADPSAASLPAWKRALQLGERLQQERSAHQVDEVRPARNATAAAAPPPRQAPVLGPRAGAASAAASAPSEPVHVARGGFPILLRAFPGLKDQPLVALVGRIIDAAEPQLLSISADATFAIDLRSGWLASAVPVPNLVRMLHTPGLVESVQLRSIAAQDFEATVRSVFAGQFRRVMYPIDVIAWDLFSEAIKPLEMRLADDFSLRLVQFPNFNRLRTVGPLDVQLAAICARTTQGATALRRAFPKHEQQVLRFMMLATLSGLAMVTPASPEPTAAGRASTARSSGGGATGAQTARTQAPAPVRRGFFKSLLEKLF